MIGDRIDIDEDELHRLLADEHKSFAAAARIMGASRSTVTRRAHALEIDSPASNMNRRELHDVDWLRARFDAGHSIAEVADELA